MALIQLSTVHIFDGNTNLVGKISLRHQSRKMHSNNLRVGSEAY